MAQAPYSDRDVILSYQTGKLHMETILEQVIGQCVRMKCNAIAR